MFIGYADLARGGITVAPVLVVIGYLRPRAGGDPHMAMRALGRSRAGGARRNDAGDAVVRHRGIAASAPCVFALYLVTLAPTTAMWDASEYITAAYTLGIPHPPGNPLFVLLGRVASLVPIGSVAVRVNLLAAVCSAFSAAIWFLVAERVSERVVAAALDAHRRGGARRRA